MSSLTKWEDTLDGLYLHIQHNDSTTCEHNGNKLFKSFELLSHREENSTKRQNKFKIQKIIDNTTINQTENMASEVLKFKVGYIPKGKFPIFLNTSAVLLMKYISLSLAEIGIGSLS